MKYFKIAQLFIIITYCSIVTLPISMAATKPTEQIQQHVAQVNINSASAQELADKLQGIGLNKAQRIVEYREQYGPFVSIEQLKEVKGIGQSILDKNLDIITF
ncbi:ComEA family DNA-binding protein [Utexia brackfieldae]|uniref:ComEA family DNA-binding protein n=1 Tax=Utexia brackfieldae TaxID=3074108 RepID=UPI00370D9BE6